ncbi:PhoH family protein [Nereida sp.]|uniref:PhoH family protein n=1 Tax=Nereida sp. TaxID=2736090 RepID=UPI003F6964D0
MPVDTLIPETGSASDQGPDTTETLLEFPDNRLLIDLCGEYDRNLSHIENVLSLQIIRRGNRLALIGDVDTSARAAQVLGGLYMRLEAGGKVDIGEIDGALRLSAPVFDPAKDGAEEKPATAAGGMTGAQIEMFKGGDVEITTRKKLVKPRTKAQKNYVREIFKNELCFGIGPAGTGKTYLAVAAAVNMFVGGKVDKIILSRPAVEAGERLGFLPGDMKDKVDPYMQPLYDALNDFLPSKQVTKMIEDKKIEIAPLAFMRGRTLANAFVVLDEAQNATSMQMKMFLTRLGEGSRMVITGDRTQVDLPRGVQSGLRDAERLLSGIKHISFNYFTAKDVVRHHLVAKIIEAYDKDDPAKG